MTKRARRRNQKSLHHPDRCNRQTPRPTRHPNHRRRQPIKSHHRSRLRPPRRHPYPQRHPLPPLPPRPPPAETPPVPPTPPAPAAPAAPAQPQKKAVKMKPVIVTGSHIPTAIDQPVSPVLTLTKKQIDESGATTISDVIRKLPQNSSGSFAENNAASFAPGASGVSLRGLGQQSTLVLING